jgi:hypothetical protein
MNLGSRPPGYDTKDDHIKVCADALNQIGEQIIKMGVRLAPHPHVNSLVQTEHETRLLMQLTDPKYVWLTTDTAHLTLGGMDPLQIMKDYWPRVVEVHYKARSSPCRAAVPKPAAMAGSAIWADRIPAAWISPASRNSWLPRTSRAGLCSIWMPR